MKLQEFAGLMEDFKEQKTALGYVMESHIISKNKHIQSNNH